MSSDTNNWLIIAKGLWVLQEKFEILMLHGEE